MDKIFSAGSAIVSDSTGKIGCVGALDLPGAETYAAVHYRPKREVSAAAAEEVRAAGGRPAVLFVSNGANCFPWEAIAPAGGFNV